MIVCQCPDFPNFPYRLFLSLKYSTTNVKWAFHFSCLLPWSQPGG